MIDKSKILAQKPKSETVEAYGESFIVQGLTGKERDAIEHESLEADNFRSNLRARLVVRSVVNEDGSRFFNDSDADALGDTDASELTKLANVAMRLGGFTNEDVEELEKN